MNKKNCMLIILLCSILIISFANSLLLFSINNNSNSSNYIDENHETTSLKGDLRASENAESGGGYIMDTDATYAWIEIQGTGTLMSTISSEGDDSEEIPISTQGWSFTFYETSYDSVYVSTNGYLSFGYKYPHDSWGDIPGSGSSHIDLIALAWEDLNPEAGGQIYYQFFGTSPNQYLVIEYYHVVDYSDELQIGDCEVILYENGNITLQYKNLNDHIDPTIGLDHGDLTNYNRYEPNLPLNYKAINFTFDTMIDVDFDLKVNEDYEIMYLTKEINHVEMDNNFGTSWETNWGLFPDMNANDIMKINITSIADNNTHWDIDYDTWDWVPRVNSFSSNADGAGNILIRQEPTDYPNPHNLSNTFPFILPNATGVWMVRANLDSFYEDIEYDSDSNSSIIESFNYIGGNEMLWWEVRYDNKGILELIDVKISNIYQMDQTTRIFRMVRICNSIKPFYVGVNEGDYFKYRIFYYADNAPPSDGFIPSFDRIKVIVGVIAGEDSMLNCTPIYYDYGFRITTYDMYFMTYSAKGFLYRNTTSSNFFNSTGFMFPFIVATNVNWTILTEDLPDTTPLFNGFRTDIPSSDESVTYTFNPNGVLNTISYKYQGKEYFVIRLYEPSPGTDDDDDDDKDKEEVISGYNLFIVFGIIGIASIALVKKLNKSNK